MQRAVRQQDKRHAGFLNRFHKAFGLRNRAFSPVQGSIQINQKTFHYPLTAPIIREFDAWVVRLYRLHKPLPTKICLPHYTTGRAFSSCFSRQARRRKRTRPPALLSAPEACSVLWICGFVLTHLPKYARISCMRADWCTWNGQRASQCPQPTQSPACFSKLS